MGFIYVMNIKISTILIILGITVVIVLLPFLLLYVVIALFLFSGLIMGLRKRDTSTLNWAMYIMMLIIGGLLIIAFQSEIQIVSNELLHLSPLF